MNSSMQTAHDDASVISDATSQLLAYNPKRQDELLLLRQSILSHSLIGGENPIPMLNPVTIKYIDSKQKSNNHNPQDQSQDYSQNHPPDQQYNDAISLVSAMNDDITPDDSVSQIGTMNDNDRIYKHNLRRNTDSYTEHSLHEDKQAHSSTSSYSAHDPSLHSRQLRKNLHQSYPVVESHLENLKRITDHIHQRAMNHAREKNVDIESIVSSSSSKNGRANFDILSSSDSYSENTMDTLELLKLQSGNSSRSKRGRPIKVKKNRPEIQYNSVGRQLQDSYSEISDQTNALFKEMKNFIHHRPNGPSTLYKRSNAGKKSRDATIQKASKNTHIIASSIVSDATTELLQYGKKKMNDKFKSRSKSTSNNVRSANYQADRNFIKKSKTPQRSRDPVRDLYHQVKESLKHPAFSEYNTSQSLVSTLSDDTRDLLQRRDHHGVRPTRRSITSMQQESYSTLSDDSIRLKQSSSHQYNNPKGGTHQISHSSNLPEDLIEKIREWPGWKAIGKQNGEEATQHPIKKHRSELHTDSHPLKNMSGHQETHHDKHDQDSESSYDIEKENRNIPNNSNVNRMKLKDPKTGIPLIPTQNTAPSLFSSHIQTPRLNLNMQQTPSTIHPGVESNPGSSSSNNKNTSFQDPSPHSISSHSNTQSSNHPLHSTPIYNSSKDKVRPPSVPISIEHNWKNSNRALLQGDELPAPPPRLSGGATKVPRAPLPSHSLHDVVRNNARQIVAHQEQSNSSISSSNISSSSENSYFIPKRKEESLRTPSILQRTRLSNSTPTSALSTCQRVANLNPSTSTISSSPSSSTVTSNTSSTSSNLGLTLVTTPHPNHKNDNSSRLNIDNTPISIQIPDGKQSVVVHVDGQNSEEKKIEIKLEVQDDLSDAYVISRDTFSLLINEITKSEPDEQVDSISAPLREVLSKYKNIEISSSRHVHFASDPQIAIQHSYPHVDVPTDSNSSGGSEDNEAHTAETNSSSSYDSSSSDSYDETFIDLSKQNSNDDSSVATSDSELNLEQQEYTTSRKSSAPFSLSKDIESTSKTQVEQISHVSNSSTSSQEHTQTIDKNNDTQSNGNTINTMQTESFHSNQTDTIEDSDVDALIARLERETYQ